MWVATLTINTINSIPFEPFHLVLSFPLHLKKGGDSRTPPLTSRTPPND